MYGAPRTPIGKRRDRVAVFSRQAVDDGVGGQANTPRKVASMWVRPVPTEEQRPDVVLAGQLTATQSYLFDVRYRSDLRTSMYFVWRQQRLEINTIVDDDALKRRLLLRCVEVQA